MKNWDQLRVSEYKKVISNNQVKNTYGFIKWAILEFLKTGLC